MRLPPLMIRVVVHVVPASIVSRRENHSVPASQKLAFLTPVVIAIGEYNIPSQLAPETVRRSPYNLKVSLDG
ncbi:MAG: hypothetical protein WCP92_09035 [bacterium]